MKKPPAKATNPVDTKPSHPGMMGDGTEEQNLGQRGSPEARIKREDVEVAFGRQKRKT